MSFQIWNLQLGRDSTDTHNNNNNADDDGRQRATNKSWYTGSFRHNKPLQEAKDDRIFNCKTTTRNTCWADCPLQAAQVNVADTMEMTSSISPMRAMVPLKP